MIDRDCSVPSQYPTRLIWQRRHRSVRIYAWHDPDIELAPKFEIILLASKLQR
jgi:hypothetical protein